MEDGFLSKFETNGNFFNNFWESIILVLWEYSVKTWPKSFEIGAKNSNFPPELIADKEAYNSTVFEDIFLI